MTAQRKPAWQKAKFVALAAMWMSIGGGFAPAIPAAIAQNYARQDPAAAQDDAKLLFSKCSACHALTPGRNGRGPTLYHLFGRKAGAVPGYDYSVAMKSASIVWRENTLAQFILNPQRVVPGTTMRFTVPANSLQMRALLDYLRTVTR